MPTKHGASMLAVAITLYGLAWATQIGWFYVADSVVWAILLVNLLLPWLGVRGLSAERRITAYSRGRSEGIFEDDTIALAITLHNRSFLPKTMITVQEWCPLAAPGDSEQRFLIGTVAPRGQVVAGYQVRCHQRGVYGFGPLRVQTFAPFGLFRARRSLAAPLEATIYPQVLPVEAAFNEGLLHGEAPDTSPPGPSGEFRGTRQFQRTDYLRNIHWKNSAKRGELMVKEFDQTPQGEVRLAFNPGVDLGEGRENTLEYAIKIAASLARRSLLDGRPFRMFPAGPSGTTASWHGVLEHLARLKSGPDAAIEELLGHRSATGVSVIVVSAADGETLDKFRRENVLGRRMVAVILEGFGQREEPRAGESLSRQGVSVVSCKVGRLPDALAALGKAMSLRGAEARRQPSRT